MVSRRSRERALLVAAAALVLAAGCSSYGSTAAAPPVEEQNVNAAVVPVVDSAGFFVAMDDGLFRAEGLNVHFIPAASSETTIDQLALSKPGAKGELDIIGGGYPSFVEAQYNWDRGRRPSVSHRGVLAANLDIFAEGALLAPGTGVIYTMPGSRIKAIADLKGLRRVDGPGGPFERYADDGLIHCKSQARARQVLAALEQRMREVGLDLHPGRYPTGAG